MCVYVLARNSFGFFFSFFWERKCGETKRVDDGFPFLFWKERGSGRALCEEVCEREGEREREKAYARDVLLSVEREKNVVLNIYLVLSSGYAMFELALEA